MQRKGQAAMEFLMTYGWAILAAIIVIGILGVYFFRGDILSPKGAVVNAPFYVNAWNADVNDGGVNLDIKNNGGDTYTISQVTLSGVTVDGDDGCTIGADTTPDPSGAIDAGSSQKFLVTITAAGTCDFTEGDTVKGDIVITYTKSGSDLELQSTGTITEKAVA